MIPIIKAKAENYIFIKTKGYGYCQIRQMPVSFIIIKIIVEYNHILIIMKLKLFLMEAFHYNENNTKK